MGTELIIFGSYLTSGIMYFHSNLAISEIQSEIFSYCDGLVSLDTSLCEFIKSDAASAISNMTINKQEPRQDFIIEVQVQEMRTVLLLQEKPLHASSFYLLH